MFITEAAKEDVIELFPATKDKGALAAGGRKREIGAKEVSVACATFSPDG